MAGEDIRPKARDRSPALFWLVAACKLDAPIVEREQENREREDQHREEHTDAMLPLVRQIVP